MVITEELHEVLRLATRSTITSRGVAEYWIVDPMKAQLTVLTLVNELCEEVVFSGTDGI